MVIKSVESANYLQINDEIKRIVGLEGIEVLSSPEAWKKYPWTKKYFIKKPDNGFFIWVKKTTNIPISTCVGLSGDEKFQALNNLIVIEKNVIAKSVMICGSLTKSTSGKHFAGGKIVLKENSYLKTTNFQSWSKGIDVNLNYEYILERNSRLDYFYKSSFTPNTLTSKMSYKLKENAILRENTIADVKEDSNFTLDLSISLIGKNSDAVSRLRVVGRKNSTVIANTKIIGYNESKGHLDCQGLVVGKNSKMNLIPALTINDNKAILTHEASIGKIADEQLNYLKSRGLSEKDSIDLIVTGFLSSINNV